MQYRVFPAPSSSLPPAAGFEDLNLEQLWQRRSYKWARYPRPVIAAWVAEMDYPVAAPVRNALQDLVDRSDWGYPPHMEYLTLGQTVAQWARERLSWPVDADAVFALGDALKGMELVLKTQIPTGSGVVIMPPVYYPFFTIPQQTGHVAVEVPLRQSEGRWHMDLDRLESVLRGAQGGPPVRALLLCHPHNPTGTVFDDGALGDLAALCSRYGVTVISDEVHGLLELQRAARWRPFSLYHPDQEQVYTVTSAAKAWNLAGLKAGLLIAHGAKARQRIGALAHRFKSGASLPGLVTLEAALRDGHPWLDDCREHLRGRAAQVAQAVASWPTEVGFAPPDASYLAWLHLPGLREKMPQGGTLRDFFLREAQVALSDGSEFGAEWGDWVRLNFATSSGVLNEILVRLEAALRRMK